VPARLFSVTLLSTEQRIGSRLYRAEDWVAVMLLAGGFLDCLRKVCRGMAWALAITGRVLVIGRLTADLAGERADVAGHEPAIVGSVPGRGTFHGAVTAAASLKRLCSSSVLYSSVFVWKNSSPESGFGACVSLVTV
jgi:hypothetical protein